MKKTAIIILNWNGEELLKRFVPRAVQDCISADSDLIVADNGSTDGSVEWLRENHPEVKVLELGENYGFAEGYNRAIAATGYEYTILLNSDVETVPGWWEPMVAYLDTHPEVGAAQPKIWSLRERERQGNSVGKDKFEYAGAAGGYLDNLGYPYCRGRLFDIVETDEGQYDGEPADICWASGAALLVRTRVYLEVGGLDARFFAHMEEIDLCCRMHAAGWRVVAVTASGVYHLGGASLNQGNPKKTYLNFRNNLLLLHKNLPVKRGRKVLFIRRLADTLAFGMYALKFDFANAGAILRAHRDFRRMRRDYTAHPMEDVLGVLPGGSQSALLLRLKRLFR